MRSIRYFKKTSAENPTKKVIKALHIFLNFSLKPSSHYAQIKYISPNNIKIDKIFLIPDKFKNKAIIA